MPQDLAPEDMGHASPSLIPLPSELLDIILSYLSQYSLAN